MYIYVYMDIFIYLLFTIIIIIVIGMFSSMLTASCRYRGSAGLLRPGWACRPCLYCLLFVYISCVVCVVLCFC